MGNDVVAYAAYAYDDEIRNQSSSGGIFSLLAEKILNVNGVVYGVTMVDNSQRAEFIRVDYKKDLHKVRGSKYMQAKVGEAYREVEKDLNSDKKVLFSGTGCQINGLKKYLGKEYENLLCVDIICHGVPSPALWKKYVEHVGKKSNSKIIEVNFRCKDVSWANFGIKMKNLNKEYTYIPKDKDSYMQMFLRNYCLRPSCYECKAKEEKFSEITIADFWGINTIMPEMDDDRGVSLVIIRNDKGMNHFKELESKIKMRSVSYEEGVKHNSAEYKSVLRPAERNVFFKDMHEMSFEELEKKYAGPVRVSKKQLIKVIAKKILRVLTGEII